MYRPDGWKNPHGSNLDRTKLLWSDWDNLTNEEIALDQRWCDFESGADALLEGLIEEVSKYRRFGNDALVFSELYYYQIIKGTWVFIPESDGE